MKKLLLLVFGLSLFIVGCEDNSSKDIGMDIPVKDYEFRINDPAVPDQSGINKIQHIVENTNVSFKNGVLVIGAEGTELLTQDINTGQLAYSLMYNVLMNAIGLEYTESFRGSYVAHMNARAIVSDDLKSVTMDFILLPAYGYAEKVISVTLRTKAHHFIKPEIVDSGSLNDIITQTSIPHTMTFTGGNADNIGSITITNGRVAGESGEILVTIGKDIPVSYAELFGLTKKKFDDKDGNSAEFITHSIEGVTQDNINAEIEGTKNMYAVLILTLFGRPKDSNVLFSGGYAIHTLPVNLKLIRGTEGTLPNEGLLIPDADIKFSILEFTDPTIKITNPSYGFITNGLYEERGSIEFEKGSNNTDITAAVLETAMKKSLLWSYNLNPIWGINIDGSGIEFKVTGSATTDPVVELTLTAKTGYKFKDGTATKTITGIKTTGTIVP